MIMFKNSTTKLFVFSLFLLLFTAAAALYICITLESEGKKLVERLQAVRDHEILARQHAEFNRQLENTKEERTALENYVLAGESGTVDLLSSFDEISSNLGVELDTKELAVAEQSDDFHELSVTLSVEGGEAEVMQFLKLLETLPYHSQVSNFAAERQAGQLELNLAIVVSIKPTL